MTDGPMRMQAERAALIESLATHCVRCKVPYGQYGCTHTVPSADRLLATINGIAAEEERKQRIRNARHALRYRAAAVGPQPAEREETETGVFPCFAPCGQPACQKLGCIRVYNAQRAAQPDGRGGR